MSPSIRYLILVLTSQCNLACAYCYRGSQEYPAPMPRWVIEQAVAMTPEGEGPLHIQFTGGEPTLAPEQVAHAARVVRERRPAATLGLQTNGIGLNEKMGRLIRDYGIQVGISLDGPAGVHDQYRGAAAQTLKGMKQLEALGVNFRVTTVVTGHNASHLASLALVLGAFSNARGLGLDLLVQKGRALTNQVPPASSRTLAHGVSDLMDALNRLNARRKRPIALREAEQVRQAAARGGSGGFCQAQGGRSAAVMPDGKVFPCSQTAGDPRFFAGTVAAPDFDALKRLATLAGSPTGADCRECPLAGACPGDCPGRRFYNNTHDAACVMYRTLWQKIHD